MISNQNSSTNTKTPIRKGDVTEYSKRAALRRVVLRTHDSLTRFFNTVIKSPACASYVEKLHCHVDLGKPTSAERLIQDITLLSGISAHLDQCVISLDLLISIRERLMQELQGKPYHPALDVRLRQSMFLSLLGHLRNLTTLRMTIHRRAHKTLSWLRSGLQQHYPGNLTKDVLCLNTCPSLKKIAFCAAEDYDPTESSIWHPLTLWPLIDLPEVEELEVDTSPGSSKHTSTNPSANLISSGDHDKLEVDNDENNPDEEPTPCDRSSDLAEASRLVVCGA
ncbi:hypothetical protein N658DRAFT_488354 [Parathielavia hyrcaniae]|uniref:Uncharacterized protein n=1 Tax=Parathielavia hyrcaniae TaxID=113614 RepID=A0AAN6SZ84_9PEZI|nr:hypothetical protein N658DRAFT_488354 [Parathielavia hyrcaniae]